MWTLLSDWRSGIVGLDVGSTSVKVVSLRRHRAGVHLAYAGLREIPLAVEGEDRPGWGVALLDLLHAGGLRRRPFAIAYNRKAPIIRRLTFPKIPKAELEEAIRWELKKIAPQPVEEMAIDYLTAAEYEDQGVTRCDLIVVAADRASLKEQLGDLKPFGIRVRAADVVPLAQLNTVRLNYPEDLEANLAFMDLGGDRTDINVAKAGTLRLTRTVPLGGDGITRAIASRFQVDLGEAEELKKKIGVGEGDPGDLKVPFKEARDLIRAEMERILLEVQRSLDYYTMQFRETAISKLLLMGGNALLPGLREFLARYLDANIEVCDPFRKIICDEHTGGGLRSLAPRFATSVGLALRRPH